MRKTPEAGTPEPELAGTGRHLQPNELRAWTGFLDAGRMLEEVLADQLVQEHSMTHREYEVLVRLDGHGGHLRMTSLANEIVASQPLISQTIAKLEDRGFVVRQAAAVDGRGVEAVLTGAGREALLAASGPHAALVRELLLGSMSAGELEAFASAIARVADHLRAHRRSEDCGHDCPLNVGLEAAG